MKQHDHNALMNYIDDLIFIGLPSKIYQSYQFLLSLLKDLGLQVSQSKLIPPDTKVTCLGIVVNTIKKLYQSQLKSWKKSNICVHNGLLNPLALKGNCNPC